MHNQDQRAISRSYEKVRLPPKDTQGQGQPFKILRSSKELAKTHDFYDFLNEPQVRQEEGYRYSAYNNLASNNRNSRSFTDLRAQHREPHSQAFNGLSSSKDNNASGQLYALRMENETLHAKNKELSSHVSFLERNLEKAKDKMQQFEPENKKLLFAFNKQKELVLDLHNTLKQKDAIIKELLETNMKISSFKETASFENKPAVQEDYLGTLGAPFNFDYKF